ncbi:MAG: hypothetical protein AAGA70_05075 [Pseudomonadota bacterium]
MRRKRHLILSIFAACGLAHSVMAQDMAWSYIGQPQSFPDRAALEMPSGICAVAGWSPENSGLPRLTQSWPQALEFADDALGEAMGQAASGALSCSVVIAPASMLAEDAAMLQRAVDLGYASLNETLMALEQTAPTPETETAPSQSASFVLFFGRSRDAAAFRDTGRLEGLRLNVCGNSRIAPLMEHFVALGMDEGSRHVILGTEDAWGGVFAGLCDLSVLPASSDRAADTLRVHPDSAFLFSP